jgi:dTDP-4-amino-4,6-dideoxygalactose transaminase
MMKEQETLRVNIADLVAQYEGVREEIEEAVIRTLRSGRYILGENVKALETEAAHYCGVERAMGANSGTDALWLSLMALGVGPGDEVIVPAFTIMVDAAVVCLLQAKPVFVDIDPSTFNLDPSRLGEGITKRTKAIVVVHLYGQMADMDPILALARHHGIAVVEDACQAIGAEYKGRKAGSLGEVGCFSFYPTKNLGAYGDGGLITLHDQALAEKIRLLSAHGDTGQYNHVVIGHNSRLDELQAAILRVKLRRVDAWNEARRRNAQRYTSALQGIKGLITPQEPGECTHVYHQYTVRTDRRDQLRASLQAHGVATALYYPIPLHLQKALGYLGYAEGDFPESEQASREVLSLPIHAELRPEQLDDVIEFIREFFRP